jgi:hypothetical protein
VALDWFCFLAVIKKSAASMKFHPGSLLRKWCLLSPLLYTLDSHPCCSFIVQPTTLMDLGRGSKQRGVILLEPQTQTRAPIKLFSANGDKTRSGAGAADEARLLLEQARRLKKEVQEMEDVKKAQAQQEQKQRLLEQNSQLQQRLRYSAEVPILKGDGSTVTERVDFRPRMNNDNTKISTLQAPLPLGMVIGEHDSIIGAFCVDEVIDDSNAALAGVKVGDLLRAVTACEVRMETPTWQLIVGGIGQPKTKRMMYSCDGRPFEEVMDAVSSNRMDPEGRDVWLVLETAVSED